MDSLETITLGCRLNGYESDLMRAHASAAGLSRATIVNTCAVTGQAVHGASHAIRRLKREDATRLIIVTGCAAEIEPGRFAAMAEVDHVIGNGEKLNPQTYAALARGTLARVKVGAIAGGAGVARMPPRLPQSRTRALVQVQSGCDHRCTFCIIPYGRGPSRSKAATDVVSEVRSLVEAGHAEVVLTGVDITDYGRGLDQEIRLGCLVRRILAEVPELARLRLSSLDSVEIDRDLLAALTEEERLMPHLHLSLQAGDDLTLKRMKRRHSRADAVRLCEAVRRLRPGIALGADLIAGFPTEDEAMFKRTLDLIDDCGLAFVHSFPYSMRPGTPAARMPQVPGPIIRERADRLRERAAAARRRHLSSWIGRRGPVLVEAGGRGRLPDFTEVVLATSSLRPAPTPLGGEQASANDHRGAPHKAVTARICGHDGRRLVGEVVAP